MKECDLKKELFKSNMIGFWGKTQMPQEWELFFMTGILGGFTTFSAFSNDTLFLFREGYVGYALIYIFSSIISGLLATYIAYLLFKLF